MNFQTLKLQDRENDMNRHLHRSVLTAALLAALAVAADAHAGSPINASHAATADAQVEVSNVRGRIQVTGWDQQKVEVTGTLGEGSEFSMEGSDSHLVIEIKSKGDNDWSWFGSRGPREDTTIEVKVPRRASLEVDGVSADVQVDGIAGAKELDVESVSGDVEVQGDAERVEVSSVSGDARVTSNTKRARLETVSGDLTARGVSGSLSAESVSGRMTLEAASLDDADLSTVSGDVELEVGAITGGRVRVESMSGEVSLTVPASLSARIEAETFSGKIRSDFGNVEDGDGPGSHLKATAGKGDAEVSLESFSGDLTIRRK